jgi:hypothetical protein
MDLLERYLQAVGQYLPEATRQDTLAELRANLQAQMDDRAEELGRPLNDGDMVAMLKAHGKPEAVALRYLPLRSLIGPTVFPFYLFTLKRVLPFVVFVSAIVKGIEFVSVRHESVADALVEFALGLVPSLLVTVAVITAIFAAIEWTHAEGKLGAKWNEWDPMKLPSVKMQTAEDGSTKPLWKRVIDLIVHCLWMAYVLIVPKYPFLIIGPGVFYLGALGVTFAPVWHTFYVLLVITLAVQLGMKLLALMPRPHAWMEAIEFATNVLAVVALSIVAWTGPLFVATNSTVNLHDLADVNQGVELALRIAVVFAAVGVARKGWQMMRRWKPARRLAF